MQTFLPTSEKISLMLPLSRSLCVPLPLLQHLSVGMLVCMYYRSGIKGPQGNIICFSYQQSDANLLSASIPCLRSSPSLCLFLPLCLSQSIQLYVVGMLEVPGAPSLVPAIQTATLHLSTVPGLLKSAMGKARDTHAWRSALLNRDRQSERQCSKLRASAPAMLHPQTYIVFCAL